MSWVLPRYVGVGHALDLLLSSRVFEADEAKDLGLVNRVLEPGEVLPAAREYARDLARDWRLLGRRVCVACPPR
jgi:enoyl-CoA hydratase/carnithine racemase